MAPRYTADSPKLLDISDIQLDYKNPRIKVYVKAENIDITKYDENQVMDIYKNYFSEAIDMHQASIISTGVQEHIFVAKHPETEGKYIVKEGNVRCWILKHCVKQGIKAPHGANHVFDKVLAFVYEDDVPEVDIQSHILTLQTGRADWSSVATAMQLKTLRDLGRTPQQIADSWNRKTKEVEFQLECLVYFWKFDAWWRNEKELNPSGAGVDHRSYSKIVECLKKKEIKQTFLEDPKMNSELWKLLVPNASNIVKLKNP